MTLIVIVASLNGFVEKRADLRRKQVAA